jgi:hypothetical protein
MTEPGSRVGYLYINGLGDGRITPKDRLVRKWWAMARQTIEHARINWYDGGSLSGKERQVSDKVSDMLKSFGGVAIIGGSAGGGLALNVFAAMKQENVCAVAAHARVKVGDYAETDRMSLFRRAKMDTKHPSQAFFDSVTKVETQTIPGLTAEDKERLLNLTQLTDMVVSLDLMQIDGVQTHRSIAFGHSGGFAAHLLADRDMIVTFAESRLDILEA